MICYIDDLCITGKDDTEHLRNLEEVLLRLAKHGIRVKRSKCRFMRDSITFLGDKMDAERKHTLPDKLDAVMKAPEPKNVHELRLFIGLVNYYRKFLPDLATVQLLNELLQAGCN